MPEAFRSQPLLGRRLIEVFCGLPAEAGAAIARPWEAAGGSTVLFDSRVDSSYEFSGSDFWRDELNNPSDLYIFEFPSSGLAPAAAGHSGRSADRPYGHGNMARETNKMVDLMVRRILALAAAGAGSLLKIPSAHFYGP